MSDQTVLLLTFFVIIVIASLLPSLTLKKHGARVALLIVGALNSVACVAVWLWRQSLGGGLAGLDALGPMLTVVAISAVLLVTGLVGLLARLVTPLLRRSDRHTGSEDARSAG